MAYRHVKNKFEKDLRTGAIVGVGAKEQERRDRANVPFDMIKEDEPDKQKRALELGTKLAKLEEKQDAARQGTAELRRRYDRDCRLLDLDAVPVGTSKGSIRSGSS